jgi:ubiquitin C
VEEQGLIYKGKRLQDDHTIASYNMDKNRVIEIKPSLANILINVKTPSGKNIPLNVNMGDSVRAVKAKIEQKEGGRRGRGKERRRRPGSCGCYC